MYIYVGLAGLIAWNIFTFALFGLDKRKAKGKKWRMRESALIIYAFLMGGIGALLGMQVFHHKTKHIKFKLLIPIAVLANAVVMAIIGYYMCYMV